LQIVWSQVDLNRRLITLQGEQTKNAEPRIVPLHPHLVMLLKGLKGGADDRVFDATNLRVEWQRACVLCGLGTRETIKPKDGHVWYKYRGTRLHDLRRSAIRNLVRAGTTEGVTMKISGHKTRAVFDRYNITSVADVQTAMQRLVDAEQAQSESLVKVPQALHLTTTTN
jgi:integrase